MTSFLDMGCQINLYKHPYSFTTANDASSPLIEEINLSRSRPAAWNIKTHKVMLLMKLHLFFFLRQLIGLDIKTTWSFERRQPHECLMLLSPRANGPLRFTYALNFLYIPHYIYTSTRWYIDTEPGNSHHYTTDTMKKPELEWIHSGTIWIYSRMEWIHSHPKWNHSG